MKANLATQVFVVNDNSNNRERRQSEKQFMPGDVSERVVHGLLVVLAGSRVDDDGGVDRVLRPVGAALCQTSLALFETLEIPGFTSMSRERFQSVQPTDQWLRSSMMLFRYLSPLSHEPNMTGGSHGLSPANCGSKLELHPPHLH